MYNVFLNVGKGWGIGKFTREFVLYENFQN